jgi:hypothetical protein
MNTRKTTRSKASFSFFSAFTFVLGLMIFCLPGCAPPKPVIVPRPVSVPWLGFHVLIESKGAAEALITEIPALAERGVNLLIVEIDYNYEYTSHPELRGDDPISTETVKKIVRLCRDLKIRLVPEFQSLGHQSWEGKTFPLLVNHPEFDETPGQYPGNKDIYCRSWCPLHPDLNPVIFDLFDEIIDVFEADALHVGMDEVFLIGSEFCPRCRGKNPAELFAQAVNDYDDHIVKKRGKEMMLWGDRLLDGVKTGYGEWEASTNGTFPAVDLIPKDIIICDWHYKIMPGNAYPSVPFFLEKGFRVLPASFENVRAVEALIDYSLKYWNDRMLGHLCTIWRGPEAGKTNKIPPLLTAAAKLKGTEQPGPKGEAGAKILANQVGYEVLGPKRAVILGHAGDCFDQFIVRDAATGEIVLTGVPGSAGPVVQWKDWIFWTVDFSPVAREGIFTIEAVSPKGNVESHPLLVQKNILERNTLSDVIYYFKGQRSSGALDRADRAMTFEGREGTVDAHGGWFDATGDYGKHLSHLSFATFFNPQQIPLVAWSLFASYRELSGRDDPNFRQYLRRLLDEAMFGADFLVRFKNPAGSFYLSVSGRGPEKKPEDRRITPKAERHLILTEETKNQFRDYGREKIQGQAAYEAGYREGAGLAIAALAMASSFPASGDFGPADYLKAAEDAFAFLEKNNALFANDGKENIIDDYCALTAATELFRATRKPVYKEAADRRAAFLIARLMTGGRNYWRADDGDRPFFHPADAGLPVISLLEYLPIADAVRQSEVREAVKKSLTYEMAVTGEVANPFDYSRQLVQNRDGVRRTSFFFPHDTETAPWWQGENARLGSMAAAARLALKHFGFDPAFQEKLRGFGRDQLNWILGLNPYDTCMLQGKGRNNPPYLFFNSYEYTNAPGGICNGITAGYADENDIDFNLHFAATGKDDDWRWGEQWLPHAAWFLVAVAIGDE